MNTAKKQYAPKGTEILLFPNSAYYDEWLDVNKKSEKKRKLLEVPLDPDFGHSIKRTKIYDDEGHFEFADLMPGNYIIMTSFDFTNSYNYSVCIRLYKLLQLLGLCRFYNQLWYWQIILYR